MDSAAAVTTGRRIKVLSAVSELFPLIKTGGLADVTGALPAALAPHGVEMLTLIPGYPEVLAALESPDVVHTYTDLFGGPARLLRGYARGLDVVAVDAPHLYDRTGNPYLGPDGKDWPDNAERFAALSRAAADFASGQAPRYRADILHCHDWQTGLGPVYARYQGGPKTVMTVHNIAFQGHFPARDFGMLGLPPGAFDIDGVEYYGGVGYLKGGLTFADQITTVSPTYAREICTPEYGMGLDGLLRTRRAALRGIINGIDVAGRNPEVDSFLPQTFTVQKLDRRAANKRAIERHFGLDAEDGLLHGVVSRLTWQKGIDILAAGIDHLVSTGARLALVGTGQPDIEHAVTAAAHRHPGRVGTIIGFDEDLSHLMHGGCDTILSPSRFEPCGLTQLYGMRYGCVPIAARTGGLSDTIVDGNHAGLSSRVATGFLFSPVDQPSLEDALARAADCFSDRELWQSLQKHGMAQDFSWDRSAAAYARLYRELATG